MNNLKEKTKIVIVGGGFAGVRTALDISKRYPSAHIVLVSDKTHFEYYPRLYRVVTGKSPLEVCVPLSDIFEGTGVRVSSDRITRIDKENKFAIASSGSEYKYDFLVLALGSETTYFGIPGVEEYSYGFKSINEALKIKKNLHSIIANHKVSTLKEMKENLHIVIVGGGASGVELAGEIVSFMKKICRSHKISGGLVRVDLIEAGPRILSQMPEDVSKKIEDVLKSSGVNVMTGRVVVKRDSENIYLKDETIKAHTLIWTAGTMPNKFYKELGFEYDKKGRVLVDEYLQVKGYENIFVIGDGASTPFSGLAQTAISDGEFVAKVIDSKILSERLPKYKPKKVAYVIPVGRKFAVFVWNKFKMYGVLPWILRYMIDFMYFSSILSFFKAFAALHPTSKLCTYCEDCLRSDKK